MAVPKHKLEKPSVKQVLQLFDQLTPKQQEKLRNTFLEDQEDIRIARERLKNPGKIWSLEELKQELDLES